jgi:hypothetical protein
MKNAVFWDVTPRGSLRTDISEERRASIMRATRLGELGTRLAACDSCHPLDGGATLLRNVGSYKSHKV